MPKKKFPKAISDNFLRGYLEVALFTGTDESDDSGGDPLDKNYSIEDFADDALLDATNDCNRFLTAYEKNLDDTGADDESLGGDLWYTRNGHGVGYWDRGYDEFTAKVLSDAARAYGEKHVYIGDDGKLHLS